MRIILDLKPLPGIGILSMLFGLDCLYLSTGCDGDQKLLGLIISI